MRLRYQGQDWHSDAEVRSMRILWVIVGMALGGGFVALGVAIGS